MKNILLIISIFSIQHLFGQNLSQKIGDIEVQIIGHYYKYNANYELTKKKSNPKNRPYLKMYFDNRGNLIKKVSFGKQHNTDLRLVDKINTYKYEKDKLTTSIEYESNYQEKIYPYWKSKYIYNQKKQLVEESMYYYKTDSLFQKTTYEYDSNSNKIKSIYNSTYYKRDRDSIGRLCSIRQFSANKLRWEWNYFYTFNQRIGFFQTHYNNEMDNTEKEILTYSKERKLIKIEKKYTEKNGINEKIILVYNKNGVIVRVEKYELYEDNYELIYYSKIKIKSKVKINEKIANQINDRIPLPEYFR